MTDKGMNPDHVEDGIPVYYVPRGPNYYDFDEEIIVLDSYLLDYPDAHEWVLSHERGHADPANQSFLGWLRYELHIDIQHHFSTSPAVTQYREYSNQRTNEQRGHPKYTVAKIFRSIWNIGFAGLRPVYHYPKLSLAFSLLIAGVIFSKATTRALSHIAPLLILGGFVVLFLLLIGSRGESA